MELKDIADILEKAPRLGRPEFNQTIELNAVIVDEMVAILRKPKVKYKRRTVGAEPQ